MFYLCTGICFFRMYLHLCSKMRACFVSGVFCLSPKSPLYFFTSQKRSQISRKYLCRPLSDRGWLDFFDIYQKNKFWHQSKYIYFKPHNFEIFQQNLITLKSATIYHCSSTMAYGIGWAQQLKKNRKRLDNTTDISPEPSTPSYSYDKLNENTDITSLKKKLHRNILEQYFL